MGDPHSVVLHMLRHLDGTYPHGVMFRTEVHEEVSGAWLHHVAGDVLARHQAQTFTLQGAPLRCILALCSLATEQYLATDTARGLHRHLPPPIAYLIWEFIEKGIRSYEAYTRAIPSWTPAFCLRPWPTAMG